MANKLKDVFSDEMYEMNTSLQFKDSESKKKFLDALEVVYNEGRGVRIEGVEGIKTSVVNGDLKYPFDEAETISYVVVAPSPEPISMDINTKYGKRTVHLTRYETRKATIVETPEDAIIYMKFSFAKDLHNVSFTCKTHLNKAKGVKDVAEGLSDALGMLETLFKPDEEQKSSQSLDELKRMKTSFRMTLSVFEKLCAIENEFQISFNPAKLDNIDDCVRTVEGLFQLLIEKHPIRVNVKQMEVKSAEMTIGSSTNDLEIGRAVLLLYNEEKVYSIGGQDLSIHTVNLLYNAVVKEILQDENGNTTVLYGDTDTKPMYVAFTGYISKEEADHEMSAIMNDINNTDKQEIYSKALTLEKRLLSNADAIES